MLGQRWENCLDILLTPITNIIYILMERSTFPQNVKEARVKRTTT